MNLFNSFPHIPFLFAPNDAGGGTDGGAGADGESAENADSQDKADKSKEADEKKFTQADVDKILKDRLAREQKKSEEAAAKAKADAEAAAMAEQGKFKELAEKNQKAAEEEKANREKLNAELRSMKLRGAFEKASAKLGLKFTNDAAAEDAFEKLDVESVGEDLKGMDDAIKKLLKDRPYLFEKSSAEDIDAKTKGGLTGAAANDATIQKKKQSGTYKGL